MRLLRWSRWRHARDGSPCAGRKRNNGSCQRGRRRTLLTRQSSLPRSLTQRSTAARANSCDPTSPARRPQRRPSFCTSASVSAASFSSPGACTMNTSAPSRAKWTALVCFMLFCVVSIVLRLVYACWGMSKAQVGTGASRRRSTCSKPLGRAQQSKSKSGQRGAPPRGRCRCRRR